ncbi:hypothetical protein M422DRAFT_55105 [Sphaerobolus stellatus SS14]|uniref:Uncharacterized protein n=1 Tax=Sphaerobolus stellatus (strain SS14) TaxID=990650 RepID=A0A0C9UPG4_SPHS4|nr:hypothetical protein M422DRAFT_55105 [Sphaerobolus stellatus SS14]
MLFGRKKKLEKIVNIWVDEMREDEDSMQEPASQLPADASKYTTYKLATLYDRYYEYADLLASQDLISEAIKYLELAPADYKGSQGSEVESDVARKRLFAAAGAAATPKLSRAQPVAGVPAATASYAQPSYPSPYQTLYIAPRPPSVTQRAHTPITTHLWLRLRLIRMLLPSRPLYPSNPMDKYREHLLMHHLIHTDKLPILLMADNLWVDGQYAHAHYHQRRLRGAGVQSFHYQESFDFVRNTLGGGQFWKL